MNARDLTRRDPAMAALMGAIGSDFGSDFGSEFGSEFGADYGADYGDDMGADYGDDLGAEFGESFGGARPAPAAMARVYAKARAGAVRRAKREVLLNPNQGSDLKVEDYTFTVNITDPNTNASPVYGTASALAGENTPDVWTRPCRVVMNVPSMGLVKVQSITIGNVNGTIGGRSDGFIYSPVGVGIRNSFPLMSPSTKASFAGSWSNLVPTPFNNGDSYDLSMTFIGPSTMAPRG